MTCRDAPPWEEFLPRSAVGNFTLSLGEGLVVGVSFRLRKKRSGRGLAVHSRVEREGGLCVASGSGGGRKTQGLKGQVVAPAELLATLAGKSGSGGGHRPAKGPRTMPAQKASSD